VRAGVCSSRCTGALARLGLFSTGRSEERRRHEAVSSGISFAFRWGANRTRQCRRHSTGRQGAGWPPIRLRICDTSSQSQRPSPRADPGFFTAGARGRSLVWNWKRHPRWVAGAAGLRTRPACEEDGSGWPVRPGPAGC
jgi:hypothetical protein